MKKVFKMVDLDCANCASKMENAIRKIEGVEEVTISFMAQKLTITADDDKFDDIMKKVVKACKKIDFDCKIEL